jgi:hypothetical protein
MPGIKWLQNYTLDSTAMASVVIDLIWLNSAEHNQADTQILITYKSNSSKSTQKFIPDKLLHLGRKPLFPKMLCVYES